MREESKRNYIYAILSVIVTIAVIVTVDYFATTKVFSDQIESSNSIDESQVREPTKFAPIVGKPRMYQYSKDAPVDQNLLAKYVTEIPKEHQIKEGGWIPPWSHNSGLEAVNKYGQDFDHVSPVWYSPAPDGTLISRKPANYRTLYDNIGKDTDVIPSIASYDAELMRSIMSNEQNRNRHIKELTDEVIRNNYDGIDIDYELIRIEDQDAFLTFIKDLNISMNQKNKILSVTVISKWNDVPSLGSLFGQTRQVQDWQYIAQHCDQFRIMGYDYTTTGSPKAGPVAPIIWLEDILKYADGKVPPEKLWLGVNLYGYMWASNGTARAVSYDEMMQSSIASQTILDKVSLEAFVEYECADGVICTSYFMNKESLKARHNLAQEYKIAGVTYWRLGNNADLLDL